MILASALTALWLGILTSISPCPLATNIAAVSFISKRLTSPLRTGLCGLTYALGRTLTYVVMAAMIVRGLMSTPYVSQWLQEYMNMLLGPILILTGMFLTNLLRLPFSLNLAGERAQRWAQNGSLWSAGLLGVLFALSFCPISAGLFFMGLIPLALEQHSALLLPALYGIGTALPVVAFAILLTVSMRLVGVVFHKLTVIDKYSRLITGSLLILIGLYFTLTTIWGLPF